MSGAQRAIRRGLRPASSINGRGRRRLPRPWPVALALLLAPVLLALSGCAVDRLRYADAIGRAGGLVREPVAAGPFTLTAYRRILQPGAPLDLYIEGDGYAWVTRTQPAADPTPRRAVGLQLAAADPAPNVVYLARPCQFAPGAHDPGCGVSLWTGRRFAPEVVAAMDEAVSHYAALAGGPRLNLVGYSGGGALAVLIAARRRDVATLRTVAGDLDIEFVNRLHGVSAMPRSLNPYDAAARVAAIPQLHFSGADDTVVPPAVAERFMAAAGPRCARVVVVTGLDHELGWVGRWAGLLAQVPACR